MESNAVRFEGRIFRPPGEANSLLLQLTVGCSHNKCAFCAMYIEKQFRVRPLGEVFEDITAAAWLYPETRRVFLCDGDALSAGYDAVAHVCEKLNASFPRLQRIAVYYNAKDILALSHEQLARLRAMKLSLGYLGLESGSAEVLRRVRKGATPEQMLKAVQRARAAGIQSSVIALLGVGGSELSGFHARETADVLNAMQPPRLSLLTTMLVPHTPLYAWARQGRFVPLTDREIGHELYSILERLDLNATVLRSNHASNMILLEGRLPKHKARFLAEVSAALPLLQDRASCFVSENEALFL